MVVCLMVMVIFVGMVVVWFMREVVVVVMVMGLTVIVMVVLVMVRIVVVWFMRERQSDEGNRENKEKR